MQAEAVRASRESVTLTLNQYIAGTVSYLSVVTVQTALLSNERNRKWDYWDADSVPRWGWCGPWEADGVRRIWRR